MFFYIQMYKSIDYFEVHRQRSTFWNNLIHDNPPSERTGFVFCFFYFIYVCRHYKFFLLTHHFVHVFIDGNFSKLHIYVQRMPFHRMHMHTAVFINILKWILFFLQFDLMGWTKAWGLRYTLIADNEID